jgi:hypothetical protein
MCRFLRSACSSRHSTHQLQQVPWLNYRMSFALRAESLASWHASGSISATPRVTTVRPPIITSQYQRLSRPPLGVMRNSTPGSVMLTAILLICRKGGSGKLTRLRSILRDRAPQKEKAPRLGLRGQYRQDNPKREQLAADWQCSQWVREYTFRLFNSNLMGCQTLNSPSHTVLVIIGGKNNSHRRGFLV